MWRKLVLLLLCSSVLLCAACGGAGEEKTPEFKTFSEYTDLEIFQTIPAIDKDSLRVMDAGDYGNGYYLLALKGVLRDDYAAYVTLLESAGFTRYADSGETGVGESVYAATFTKDSLSLSVAFMPYIQTAYIVAAENKQISPNLRYDASYVADNIPDAKTTVTMYQDIAGEGNCYIIQLKNGHFIINDGGSTDNLMPLIEYLEKLTPEGQKPCVDAWFISHEHGDHVGVFKEMSYYYADKMTVEGFYINQISEDVKEVISVDPYVGTTDNAMAYFSTASGDQTPIYRCHAGDRYYFCDITVEVLHTNEQIMAHEYVGNLNASSTWLMFNIEGQKFLNAGDAEIVNMRIVAETFDPEYMDVDVMNVHHHGGNLYTDDLNYYKCETLLYSTVATYSIYWPEDVRVGTPTLQSQYCEEYLSFVDGGKRLTFPYTVGSAETVENLLGDRTDYYIEREQGWLRDAGLLA